MLCTITTTSFFLGHPNHQVWTQSNIHRIKCIEVSPQYKHGLRLCNNLSKLCCKRETTSLDRFRYFILFREDIVRWSIVLASYTIYFELELLVTVLMCRGFNTSLVAQCLHHFCIIIRTIIKYLSYLKVHVNMKWYYLFPFYQYIIYVTCIKLTVY